MKKILGIYDPPRGHWVGDGFPVRSLFSYNTHGRDLSPFLLLDYAGPHAFEPTTARRGVGEHPHRGFETVTIVYDGEVEHRDSTGAGGRIGPGDVQWMTAASGILHEEYHSADYGRRGGPFEMVQLWVNLPAADKMTAPRYQTLLDRDIPRVGLPGDAGTVRVIAGEHAGQRGPALTHTPMDVWDVQLKQGRSARFAFPDGHTLALVLLHGTVLANDSQLLRGPQLMVFDRTGTDITLEANNDAALLLLGGQPIEEPIVGRGPFVMNTMDEIRQAFDDFNSGRFGRIAA
ncbi:MAG: pirin family protein [Gammaproteobacteria bacterium PRO9]|nr:pirin family protein [Gammaproteobacteria bacterium PRO9]